MNFVFRFIDFGMVDSLLLPFIIIRVLKRERYTSVQLKIVTHEWVSLLHSSELGFVLFFSNSEYIINWNALRYYMYIYAVFL